MIDNYQNLPYLIDPVIFSIGPFSLEWYSLMYIFAFVTIYFLLNYRIRKREGGAIKDPGELFDLLLHAFLGVVIGGRLGYVLFYNLPSYVENPLAVISPFDPISGEFVGIYGMSYHGGLMGAILAGWIFCRRRRMHFRNILEFVMPAVPAGYFFGRIGNFFNGELYGRVTEKSWGMYFPNDSSGFLRHPSQLYEAFFEGLVLFTILWVLRKNPRLKGRLFPIYIIGYAFFRFFIEFFREPDEQIGYISGLLTMGQLLNFFMLMMGIWLIFRVRNYSDGDDK